MAALTKQAADEKIREAVKAPLRSEVSTSDIVAGFISSTKLEEIVHDIKQLINSEVLSAVDNVLNMLDAEIGMVDDDNAISGERLRKNMQAHGESIKNRYNL